MLAPFKPIRIAQGSGNGVIGQDGQNGSNANITVEPEENENDISVREETVGTVKKYYLSVDVYEPPSITVETTAPKVYMQGTVIANKNVSITTQKGSKPVTTLVVTDPSGLNAGFQSTLNVPSLNVEEQPVITTLAETNISTDRDYTITVGDGVETVSATDTLRFHFPYLHGASASLSFDRFITLTKTVAPKQTQEFAFADEDKYFFIGFPSSYVGVGQSYIVRDQNGFDVTETFTAALEDIDSTGLDSDWTEEYIILHTSHITEITGTYTVEFV
jgi:hypothetical protein